jgi:hypothetical protein
LVEQGYRYHIEYYEYRHHHFHSKSSP